MAGRVQRERHRSEYGKRRGRRSRFRFVAAHDGLHTRSVGLSDVVDDVRHHLATGRSQRVLRFRDSIRNARVHWVSDDWLYVTVGAHPDGYEYLDTRGGDV